MKASPFFWGFLAVQAVAVALWAPVLASLLSQDDLISTTVQLWSRSGDAAEAARPFRASGGLLTASLFLLGSSAALVVGSNDFRAGLAGRSLIYLVIALLTGAAGIAFIASEWTRAVMYPPGSLDVTLLYMATRAWMIQVFLAYAILLVFGVLIGLGVTTPERPAGWGLAVLNWWICAGLWVGLHLFAYVLPQSLGGA